MKHSLYFKFIGGYLIFGFISFVTISFFSYRLTEQYLIRHNANMLYEEAVAMATAYEDALYYETDIDTEIIPHVDLLSRFISSDIWITTSSGKILLDSDPASHSLTEIPGFDPAAVGQYTIGDYYGMFPSDVLTVCTPITSGYLPVGYVIIHMPMSHVVASTNEILNIIYLTATFIFLLSLIILGIFTVTVYHPLKAITYAAGQYAKGHLDYRIRMDGHNDEIGYLANTLDYMAQELNQSEEYQKSFIANVSHDFRSPLTSIKGYSEAILDGTIPEEMRGKYLERVIAETERLNKLTESMLTLNLLDAKANLKRSSFDINRTIKDVCASNENICLKKGITFDLTFADELEMVYADYGKIQQVLYNLIDNAIKFSPPDSTIYISTTVRQKKVFVSVKDTGCGIPKDSIKKIWDRFYKSDPSRGRDKRGTGLGLSIVREIIQAHGETIDVVSTEKVGSDFTFSLPLSEDSKDPA